MQYCESPDTWNSENGRELINSNQKIYRGSLAIAPDGARACFFDNGKVELWDVNAGTLIRTMGDDFGAPFVSAQFTPNGSYVLLFSTKYLDIFNLQDGTINSHCEQKIQASQISADGSRIAASEYDTMIVDVHTGSVLADLPSQTRSLSDLWIPKVPDPGVADSSIFRRRLPQPQFSSDGMTVLAGDSKDELGVWCRNRPEYWWGVAWLPEFWLTSFFTGALLWSLWRDRKSSPRLPLK